MYFSRSSQNRMVWLGMVGTSCEIRDECLRLDGAGGQTMILFDLGGVLGHSSCMVQFFVQFFVQLFATFYLNAWVEDHRENFMTKLNPS